MDAMKFDNTLGAILLGGVLTAMLYGMLCIQCFGYFHRWTGDSTVLKYSVWAIWVANTGHLIFIVHIIYLYMVTNFGNLAHFLDIPWSTLAMSVATLVTTVFVHSWYCYRVWIMSNKSRAVTYPLLLIAWMAFGFGMTLDVKLFLEPTDDFFVTHRWLALTSLGIYAVTDLYIAIALCYILFKQRKGLTERGHGMVNSLIIYTVNTGLMTGLCALAVLLTCATMPNNFVWIGIYFLVGELYSNSLIASLNARDRLRREREATLSIGAALTSVRFTDSAADVQSDTMATDRIDLEAYPSEADLQAKQPQLK